MVTVRVAIGSVLGEAGPGVHAGGQRSAADGAELEGQRGARTAADRCRQAGLPGGGERLVLRELRHRDVVGRVGCSGAGRRRDNGAVPHAGAAPLEAGGVGEPANGGLQGGQGAAQLAVGRKLRLVSRLLGVQQQARPLLDRHQLADDAVYVQVRTHAWGRDRHREVLELMCVLSACLPRRFSRSHPFGSQLGPGETLGLGEPLPGGRLAAPRVSDLLVKQETLQAIE